jgi:hypothetical protein
MIPIHIEDLILRSAPKERVSKNGAAWFETRLAALLTMRVKGRT